MCGIAGCFHLDGRAALPEAVNCMITAIAHRGPDANGIYCSGGAGLGHRRLAIIDLSDAGRCPMSDWYDNVYITYNGEIFNYREVRQELEAKGYKFRSHTDTEVVINAYIEWGVDCLQRFNGMFAFALWDEPRQRMWLVRDRLGVKPLFYARTENSLYFGSEIKAILAHPDYDNRQIDYAALSYFLAANWMPAPHTLFAGIRQLMPGHHVLIERDGTQHETCYWDMRFQEDGYKSEQSYLDEFNALIEDAVKIRLVGDVPFGSFLSGGLDSSTVAYYMARQLNQPVKTFSIGFEEDSFNETDYAREMAKAIGANHHERIVRADDAELIPKLVWHAEEPTADSSMVAVYAVSKLAREHVTMIHSGDGGDELFAGYPTYQAHYLHKMYRWLPGFVREKIVPALVDRLPVSDAKVSTDAKLRRFVYGGRYDYQDAHALWRVIFNKEARAALLAPTMPAETFQADLVDVYRDAFARTNARHPVNRLSYTDTRVYLPGDMLVKVDRMSMAHGLEARTPFLDYRMVEFAARVPPWLKLKNFRQNKYLVKAAMRDKLPPVISGRRKAGFNVPNARWIKRGLKSFVTDTLSPARLNNIGWFNPGVVENLLKDHFEERADNSHQIWSLLTLSLWWQQYIEPTR
jgi:asparagine synthase (glutamine-hydrolysing)